MKRNEMDDKDLVRECLRGNVEFYHDLMGRYRETVMAVALNILMNYEDAQDVCQEAFLKAFRNLENFDLQKSFKNWFYSLLYNSCLDHIRKRKRFFNLLRKFRIETSRNDILPSTNSPSPHWEEFKLLSRLSPRERISIYLWSQEGYTGSEIASVLGCSHKTAHVYLYKAREKLKALLKEKKNGKL